MINKIIIGALVIISAGTSGYSIYSHFSKSKIKGALISKELFPLTKNLKDQPKWEILVDEYLDSSSKKPKINNFFLQKSAEKSDYKDENIRKLQRKCDKLLETYYLGDEDLNYITAKNWCTKDD